MNVHPTANIFPPMSAAEYGALLLDIKEHGQHEAIWAWRGQIIDGRHRAKACEELGIACDTREWNGTEEQLIAFVISLNLHRRHLNESQRALVAARLATMPQGARTDLEHSADLPKVSQPQAATLLNVSDRSIRDVKRVEREAPELLPAIEAGELTLNAAVGELKKRERVVKRGVRSP